MDVWASPDKQPNETGRNVLTKQKRNKVGRIRRAIRILQTTPIILSLFVVLCNVTDILCVNLNWLLCPLFGFSVFVLLQLYRVSRLLYVSRWSCVLYVTLIMIVTTELIDEIFALSLKGVEMQQFIFCTLITGTIVSLLTFIYDKFKHGF